MGSGGVDLVVDVRPVVDVRNFVIDLNPVVVRSNFDGNLVFLLIVTDFDCCTGRCSSRTCRCRYGCWRLISPFCRYCCCNRCYCFRIVDNFALLNMGADQVVEVAEAVGGNLDVVGCPEIGTSACCCYTLDFGFCC